MMNYHAPTTLQDAVALLEGAKGVTRILAGGTDVIVQMNALQLEPDTVVDIKKIEQMGDIASEDGGFRIGAAVSCAELSGHELLSQSWPGVCEAAGLIGSTQIQNRATIVGNLCNGSPAADSVPALIAADARATIIGPNGERVVPVAEIPTGPGKTGLAKGEIVVSIFLPPRSERSGDAYLRFIPRSEMDIAVVGVGINLTLDDAGLCTAARVALGAVAPTALLSMEAGDTLIGTRLDNKTLDLLAVAVSAACRPIDDKRGTAEYRTKVAGVLARRAATTAMQRAGSTK